MVVSTPRGSPTLLPSNPFPIVNSRSTPLPLRSGVFLSLISVGVNAVGNTRTVPHRGSSGSTWEHLQPASRSLGCRRATSPTALQPTPSEVCYTVFKEYTSIYILITGATPVLITNQVTGELHREIEGDKGEIHQEIKRLQLQRKIN